MIEKQHFFVFQIFFCCFCDSHDLPPTISSFSTSMPTGDSQTQPHGRELLGGSQSAIPPLSTSHTESAALKDSSSHQQPTQQHPLQFVNSQNPQDIHYSTPVQFSQQYGGPSLVGKRSLFEFTRLPRLDSSSLKLTEIFVGV